MITLAKTRQTTRNLSRFFVKLRPLGNQPNQLIDALIADTSEDGVGIFTESLLPIGTNVEIIIDNKEHIIGRVINRDYLFPENTEIIRLGIHFDKPFEWKREILE